MIVSLFGELDLSCADVLRDEVDRIEAQATRRELLLDLRELDFLDSNLRLLWDLEARCRARAGSLALIGANGTVQRLLTVTGTDTRFRFVATANVEPGPARDTPTSVEDDGANPTA
jgi:anti-anti-sigma factor